MKTRDVKIDIMRVLAIISIFIAHSEAPDVVFQLRNFDVTMMAFLMGVSFYISQQKKDESYLDYVKKRFKRLIVPSWRFLILFIMIFSMVALVLGDTFYFSTKEVIGAFLLIQGFTYLWIMGTFFAVSLVLPLLKKVSGKIENHFVYFGTILGIYLMYHALVIINSNIPWEIFRVAIQNYLLLGLGYGLVAAIGIRVYEMKNSELAVLAGIFFAIYMTLGFTSSFSPVQNFKYPPTMYYLSYGLMISCGLLLFMKVIETKLKQTQLITWASLKSFDLYMYHIIAIHIIDIFGGSWDILESSFIAKFFFLLMFSIFAVFLEQYLTTGCSKIKSKIETIRVIEE